MVYFEVEIGYKNSQSTPFRAKMRFEDEAEALTWARKNYPSAFGEGKFVGTQHERTVKIIPVIGIDGPGRWVIYDINSGEVSYRDEDIGDEDIEDREGN